jgi:hypothetical protein
MMVVVAANLSFLLNKCFGKIIYWKTGRGFETLSITHIFLVGGKGAEHPKYL